MSRNVDMAVELSVVIVTHNSLPFVRLCLDTLFWQTDDRLEVIMVDNASSDQTVSVVRTNYPLVKVIANDKNVGFGTACNQGMRVALGRYYLMLNPDTVVPEDITQRVLAFMLDHPDCGGMGVYMTDGMGCYLPESKRGLPTLFRSFCRFSGLTALCPASRRLAGYYLGHLSEYEVSEVEVLSGACMVLRADAIAKCGGFDERFFMYGEDIDLSWRLKKAGFKIFYNPSISIIHFKGESTIKDDRYVKHFFGAMGLFYHIHFKSYWNRLLRPVVFFMTRCLSLAKRWQLAWHNRRSVVSGDDSDKESEVIAIDASGAFMMGNADLGSDFASVAWLDMHSLSPREALHIVQDKACGKCKVVWLDARHEYGFEVTDVEKRTRVFKVLKKVL
ncbi:glycosyltransferase family 2 protein [Geofilum sp. OHC36d9]|uniref:glycosyltransferase family 2 protein n=1 Tax=Geofilum sp. OHC36d9 TaxID=3458413 RepID=UPI00403341AA